MPSTQSTLFLAATAFAAVLAPCAVAAAAKNPSTSLNPAALQKVLDCRALADAQARLACYDASVAQLDAAHNNGDLAIVGRDEVNRARRGLFGFTLPSLALFNGHKSADPSKQAEDDDLKEITGTIRAVSRNADGGWILTLEDGARWEQTGAMTFGRNPRPGATVTIKRAAMGSFKMSVDGSPAVKARRIG